jgi:hypothetical protein
MNQDWTWSDRLETAVRLLEAAPHAPTWLVAAVKATEPFAQVFESNEPGAGPPADFYYPH